MTDLKQAAEHLLAAALRAALAASAEPSQEPVAAAMQIVTDAMRADPDYAWSWHCNIAMSYVDAGGDHYTGNQGAAKFMRLLANVEPAHELPEHPAPVEASVPGGNSLAEKIMARIVLCYGIRPADVATACDTQIDRSGNLLGWIREAVRLAASPAAPAPEAESRDALMKAAKSYMDLRDLIASSGRPPHTDFWHQSVYVAESALRAAIDAAMKEQANG